MPWPTKVSAVRQAAFAAGAVHARLTGDSVP